ncbi:olfactomedin-4-like, partial [Bufo bufo]|uniref:olfactomedin-4-like n=1 Tax=Bufo bufo TaxID=8384 RepID=UPI001ABE22F7
MLFIVVDGIINLMEVEGSEEWMHLCFPDSFVDTSKAFSCYGQYFTYIGNFGLSQQIQNFTGSLDELGVCHCSSVLPDSTFPADRFEMLEMSNQNMTITVEQQINKIHHYESTLNSYTERLANLTKRVEVMETGGLSYTELDFELVKLEIREMEALVLQLKSSMNGTNVQVEALYLEMRNLSIMVSHLEVYDKNNVMVIRREIAALKKRLEDCEKNQTIKPTPYLPQMHN